MRTEPVEIYSDITNAVVMRHPDRKYPGVLIQGETLTTLCRAADDACAASRHLLPANTYDDLNALRNHLQALLGHYKAVLSEHGIPLPFSQTP